MKVYKIGWDYSHLCDMDYDIGLIKSKEIDSLDFERNLMFNEVLPLTKPLHFVANFNTVKSLDFPVSKGLLVCSKTMIEHIEENSQNALIKYPVLLLDDQFSEKWYDENGNLKPELNVLDNYQLIQPTKILQLIDLHASSYKEMRPGQLWPTIIYNLVLKEPKDGFPGIFRLKEKRSSVFINETVMNSFQNANIKGCTFEEVEVTPFEKAI